MHLQNICLPSKLLSRCCMRAFVAAADFRKEQNDEQNEMQQNSQDWPLHGFVLSYQNRQKLGYNGPKWPKPLSSRYLAASAAKSCEKEAAAAY